MYWIYDLPTWLFGVLTLLVVVGFALSGQLLVQRLMGRYNTDQTEANALIGYFFGGSVGLYGITLGLIAVGAWQNFKDVQVAGGQEAAALASLYRNVDSYPGTAGVELSSALIKYTDYVIEQAWPMQQRGVVPKGGTALLSEFQHPLFRFEPTTAGQVALHQGTLHQFSRLIEFRRIRLQSVGDGLPGIVWAVVLLGAALSISLTWLFIVDSKRLHHLLTGSYACLIALLLFLMAAMDNPYRGEFSVGPDAFVLVRDQLMRP
jgi:hypothetical protein